MKLWGNFVFYSFVDTFREGIGKNNFQVRSRKGVREACWKHQHSGDQLSILTTGYFPVRAFAKRAGSISIRAINYQFDEKVIFRMLRPYFARAGVRSQKSE
jgi:hypothetical protein